ncbi:AlbA family DNA-binding domain-containing protein [Sphingobium yanoikuyae]
MLSQSYTEQSSYDFKQGFLTLSDDPKFDDGSFEKILKTLVGISNLGRERLGYVLVGVAENEQTADRVEKLFRSKVISFESFWITGVDHEASKLKKSPDQFFQMIVDKVIGSKISEPLKSHIASNIKPVRYYDKTIYVFETKGMPEPSLYDNGYYVRNGVQLELLEPAKLSQLFKRYLS